MGLEKKKGLLDLLVEIFREVAHEVVVLLGGHHGRCQGRNFTSSSTPMALKASWLDGRAGAVLDQRGTGIRRPVQGRRDARFWACEEPADNSTPSATTNETKSSAHGSLPRRGLSVGDPGQPVGMQPESCLNENYPELPANGNRLVTVGTPFGNDPGDDDGGGIPSGA